MLLDTRLEKKDCEKERTKKRQAATKIGTPSVAHRPLDPKAHRRVSPPILIGPLLYLPFRDT